LVSKTIVSGKWHDSKTSTKENLTEIASFAEQASLKVQLWVFVRNVLGSLLGQRIGCSD